MELGLIFFLHVLYNRGSLVYILGYKILRVSLEI